MVASRTIFQYTVPYMPYSSCSDRKTLFDVTPPLHPLPLMRGTPVYTCVRMGHAIIDTFTLPDTDWLMKRFIFFCSCVFRLGTQTPWRVGGGAAHGRQGCH